MAIELNPVFYINPEATFTQSAENSNQYFVSIKREQLILSLWVYKLVELICHTNDSELQYTKEKFAKEENKSLEEIDHAIRYLLAYGIVLQLNMEQAQTSYMVEEDKHILHNMAMLSAKRAIINDRITYKIGRLFAPLFCNTAIIAIFILFLSLLIPAIIYAVDQYRFFLDPEITIHSSLLCFPLIFIATSISGILHEFGHLGACVRCGQRPGEVGIGIYFTSIVLYSDVGTANVEKRLDRIKIDIGGIIIDLVFICGFLLGALLSNNIFVYTISFALLFQVIENLDPFKKTDAYWMLTDIAGIPNLHIRLEEWVLRNNSANEKANRILIAYFLYCVAIIVFLVILAVWLLPRYIVQYPASISGYFSKFVQALEQKNLFQLFLNIYLLLFSFVPLIGISLMIKRAINLIQKRSLRS